MGNYGEGQIRRQADRQINSQTGRKAVGPPSPSPTHFLKPSTQIPFFSAAPKRGSSGARGRGEAYTGSAKRGERRGERGAETEERGRNVVMMGKNEAS